MSKLIKLYNLKGVHLIVCKFYFNKVDLKMKNRDFPGDAVVGSPPANAGDMGTSPGAGRSHMPQSN